MSLPWMTSNDLSAIRPLRPQGSSRPPERYQAWLLEKGGLAVDSQPLPAPDVRLRSPRREDCEMILEWRNDPWIVSLAKSRQPVPEHVHRTWFAHQLTRDDSRLFIIQFRAECHSGYQDAGIARIDKDPKREGVALISIYLRREFTGRGIGGQALRQAVACAFSVFPDIAILRAEIQRTNVASIKSFRRAGFAECPWESGSDRSADIVDLCIFRT